MSPSEFWSAGDYRVIGDRWAAVGRDVVDSLDVKDRDIIDLATGTGVTAIAAARAGARSVTGVDVTPVLLTEAARRATEADLSIDWVEADVASVPLPDRSADLVTSTFGVVFAEGPAAALAEAHRLTRAGGSVVFTSWARWGLFGRVRRVLAEHLPDAPTPWSETAEDIVGVAGEGAVVVERTFTLDINSPASFVDEMERYSAPIVLAAQRLGERWPTARGQLIDAVTAAGQRTRGAFRAEVPYLVTTLEVD